MTELFAKANIKADEATALSIEISEVSQANRVLNGLTEAGIEPLEYSISQASLDEVFMTFTGNGGQNNG